MMEARRKTRIALLEAGLTFRDLEQATGLKRCTIHNLLSDPSGSAKAKQTITKFLGVEISPEIAVTKRRVLFTHSVEFHSGRIYDHPGVPESVFRELMVETSKGAYYNQQIRGKYR